MGPSPNIAVYKTPEGLSFWMDYRDRGSPYEAPTIRTTDPDVWICFMPPLFRDTEAFLFCCDGERWIFSRPDASTMLDTDELENLQTRNPHLDVVISEIRSSFTWRIMDGSGHMVEEISANSGFRTREQQDRVTGLFCDLMAWVALNGPIAMAYGGWRNQDRPLRAGIVGFDRPLQQALDRGDYIL